MTDQPLKVYTREELQQQRLVIERILQTGTPAEVERLKITYHDPELHPRIRELIMKTAAANNMRALFIIESGRPSERPEGKHYGPRRRK